MKKTKIIGLTSALIAFATAASVTTALLMKGKETEHVFAYDNYIWDYPFECDDWYFSGKGFQIDFTFNPSDVTGELNQGLELLATGDQRVTNQDVKLYFHLDGSVTSNKGNVIKNDDGTYSFTVMFNEFINGATIDGNVITGHEHVQKINFRWVNVPLTKVRAQLIDSKMNVVPRAELRDETGDNLNGLMFKCYVPEIKENTKYGMAIVPNEYLGQLTSNYCASFTSSGKPFVESYCNPLPIQNSDPLYDRYGGGYYIKCSMTGVKEANYLRDFSAVAFEETSGVRKYAWNCNEEKDNLYNVCTRALSNSNLSTKCSAYRNSILSNVKNRTSNFSSTNLTAKVIYSTDQYLKNDSDIVSINNKISLKAAKGETENAQILLSSTANNIELFAGVSNLETNGNIITCDNIETDMVLYNNVTSNWSATSDHVNARPKFYPNGAETLKLGYWPDALLPMDVAVRTGRNKIVTTNGANQALFFRIDVPNNATAGTYTGNVVVYGKGESLLTIPVELEVLDFSLENNFDSNNIIIMNKEETQKLYGYKNPAYVIGTDYYGEAIDFLTKRNISGGLINGKVSAVSDLPAYVEAVKKYLKNGKTDTYLIDYNQDSVTMDWNYRKSYSETNTIHLEEDVFCLEDSSNGSKAGLKSILTALVEGSTSQLDLLKGAAIYDPHADEPSTGSKYVRNILNYNSLRKAIDYVAANADFTGKENVRESLLNIFYICTAGPEKYFVSKENSDAYCDVKSISNVSGADNCGCATLADITYRELLDYTPSMMWAWNSGQTGAGNCYDALAPLFNNDPSNQYRAWEYTCVQPVAPYPSYTLNTDTIRIRANLWRQFSLNYGGFLFYMANRSSVFENGERTTQLTEEQILNGGVYYEGASSDGLLIYPVHNMFSYADRHLYYLSSLRLECTSEGADDQKYLSLAKKLIMQQDNKAEYLARLESICASLSVDYCPAKVTNDASLVTTARNNLINLILELN